MAKTRICPEQNCNRELDKYQHFCSECAQIRRDITNDICRHNNEQKPGRIKSKALYQKQYKKDNRESHKAYMKNYHKENKNR